MIPVFHPRYILETQEWKNGTLIEKIWKEDIQRGLSKVQEPVYVYDLENGINYIEDRYSFLGAIKMIKDHKLISFDYETTGIKPHHPDQKIICTSVSCSALQTFVWMNDPEKDEIFKKILQNPEIMKTAHNSNFEDIWSEVKLGAKIQGWEWCSMNNAHILDNRHGISGLKFQTYVNFGVCGYDDLVSPYLKARNKKEKGANGINRIEEFIKKYGKKELMKYCGFDSIYGYMLTTKQMKEIGYECSHSRS